MSILSDAQIIALWINEGGSIGTAASALAHALAESSGSSTVTSSNPDGGTNVGLFQLDTKGVGAGYSVQQLQNPYLNTQLAIKGSNNGTNWTAWPDAWQEFISAANAAVAAFTNSSGAINKLLANVTTSGGGGTASGTTGTGTTGSTGTTGTTNTGSDPLGVSKLLAPVTGLVKDMAVALDYILGMFGRGQGWRLVFTALMVAAGVGAWKCLASVGVVPGPPTVIPVPV